MTLAGLGILASNNNPPTGIGVYARDQTVDWLAQFDFVAVNATRADAVATAQALIARGKVVWGYRSPSSWLPTDTSGNDSDYEAMIARDEAFLQASGAVGSICDPETGWAGATQAQAQGLADAIAASIARGYKWGVTCFASGMPGRWMQILATTGAWGSPQIYHSGPEDAQYLNAWLSAFGPSGVILSVALTSASMANEPGFASAADYAAYLAQLPPTQGSIGWTTPQTSDAYVAAYLAWGRQNVSSKALTTFGVSNTWWPWLLGAAAVAAGVWWWRRKPRKNPFRKLLR